MEPKFFQGGVPYHHCSLRSVCLKTLQNKVGIHSQAMGSPEEQHGMQVWLWTLGYVCLLEKQLNVTRTATAYSKNEMG